MYRTERVKESIEDKAVQNNLKIYKDIKGPAQKDSRVVPVLFAQKNSGDNPWSFKLKYKIKSETLTTL